MSGLRSLPPAAAPVGLHSLWRALFGPAEAQAGFASALADYLDIEHIYLADSGRSALFLLLDALRGSAQLRDRNEVVLPAYTCPALTKVILDAGLRPCWVDLHPQSMEMVAESVARQVGASTLAIIVVHPFGLPHPLEELQQVANQAGAVLIEDVAQSIGACNQGQRVGTAGDFGLYSFGPGKPLSTGGGGFVSANRTQYVQVLDSRWHSVARPGAVASLAATVRLGLFEVLFHPLVWGMAAKAGIQRIGESEASWEYRLQDLTNAQAVIGQRLLPALDRANANRRAIASQLAMMVSEIEGLRVPVPERYATCYREVMAGSTTNGTWLPIFLRFPILAHNIAVRNALHTELVKAGIGAGKMYRKTMASYFPHLEGRPYPGAEAIVDTILTLPTHPYVEENDLAKIRRVLQRWV